MYNHNLLETAILRLKLGEYNYSQEHLDFALKYFSCANDYYDTYKNMDSFDSAFPINDTIFDDKDFRSKLYKAIKYAVLKSEWTLFDMNKKNFLSSIKKHIKNYEKNGYEKLNYSELLFAIEDNVNAFRVEINTNKNGLVSLKEHAQKHQAILMEINKRMKHNKSLAKSEIPTI
jgi:hypothetical protein